MIWRFNITLKPIKYILNFLYLVYFINTTTFQLILIFKSMFNIKFILDIILVKSYFQQKLLDKFYQ